MRILREGVEIGDLARLVHNELHIDEWKSKMGEDRDVVVISFKVGEKEPANDLVNFIEKGYECVIDADVSSGEMDDGDYIVFVEMPRCKEVPEQIMEIMTDCMNLTGQSLDEYRVRYYKNTKDHELTIESLTKMIPLTPQAYDRKYGHEEIEHHEDDLEQELKNLKTAAGLPVKSKEVKNESLIRLQIAAGIR